MRTDILTSRGRYFDFVDMGRNKISIEEVAHSLSHICRFTGHVKTFYSVAQHSVWVSRIVPAQHALAGLLHDASEAFIGDVAAPLKQLLPDYKAVEARVEAMVLGHFGLPAKLPAEVKHADQVMLATERRDLMPATADAWEHQVQGIAPLDAVLTPWCAERARWMFLHRYAELVHAADRAALLTPDQC